MDSLLAVAKKGLDGTYTIVASYNHLKNAQANDGGDYLIQTYQDASGLAKFVGGFLGAICLGHFIWYATGAFLASLIGGDGVIVWFLLGGCLGLGLAWLIGEKIAKSIMGRKVYNVQEKIKMRF